MDNMPDINNVSLQLWVDMPARLVLTEEFFRWFAEELKFDALTLMIDGSDRAVKFYWSAKQIEQALRRADPYAIALGLTTWPYPNKEQIDEMCRQMAVLLDIGPIVEWETDEEFNWRKSEVVGFKSIGRRTAFDLAGDYFVKSKADVCAARDVRNTMTTFTYHVENGPKADTAQHMDRVMVQAYAISRRDGKTVGFDHRFGPGRMQKITLDRTMRVPGVKNGMPELGVGNALWSQKFGGHTPQEAMETSLKASMAYPVVALSWWDAKFAYPKSPHYKPYAEKFLKSLRP